MESVLDRVVMQPLRESFCNRRSFGVFSGLVVVPVDTLVKT